MRLGNNLLSSFSGVLTLTRGSIPERSRSKCIGLDVLGVTLVSDCVFHMHVIMS